MSNWAQLSVFAHLQSIIRGFEPTASHTEAVGVITVLMENLARDGSVSLDANTIASALVKVRAT